MTATVEVLCILGLQEDMKLVRSEVAAGGSEAGACASPLFESEKDTLLA